MPRDLSDLPRAQTDTSKGGRPPHDPVFTGPLLRSWFQHRLTLEQRPTVLPDQPWRPSKAGTCERNAWYHAHGYPVSDPPDMAANWSFEMGQMVHDWFDKWMPIAFPGIQLEAEFVVKMPGGTSIGGNADAFHPELIVPAYDKPMRVAFELKSINGFGFKKATQGNNPEGPRDSAEIQGSIAGLGHDADLVVIVNMALEVTSAGVAKRQNIQHPEQRFSAEWVLTRDEFAPIAINELARIEMAIESELPAPRRPLGLPVMAEVTDPIKGEWWELNDAGVRTNRGNTWQCDYCERQTLCVQDSADAMTAAAAQKIWG